MGNEFFRITSEFGARDTALRTYPHTGIDLATYTGTPLPSLSDGYVSQIFHMHKSIGNGIKVKNDDGTEVIYAHLSEVSVKVGEEVDLGEIIGKTGNTGNSSGPHLHIGAKENGEYIDPSNYVEIFQKLAHKLLDPDWSTLQTIFSTLLN